MPGPNSWVTIRDLVAVDPADWKITAEEAEPLPKEAPELFSIRDMYNKDRHGEMFSDSPVAKLGRLPSSYKDYDKRDYRTLMLGYSLNSPAVVLASTATVKDPDNTDFAGGWLKVQITSGGDANDQLSIGGAFKVVGSNLIWNNQATIGTVQGGVGDSVLMVQLNADATLYRVEQLVRSIKFWHADYQQDWAADDKLLAP